MKKGMILVLQERGVKCDKRKNHYRGGYNLTEYWQKEKLSSSFCGLRNNPYA
jgi:hypothetical protein